MKYITSFIFTLLAIASFALTALPSDLIKSKNTILVGVENSPKEPIEVSITSKDGLSISGNLYEIDKRSPVILLCHQAGYNKFEYADIAPRLNELGYNCLAIDQRSGGTFASKKNVTFEKAKAQGLSTNYLDAEQDIVAALEYLVEKYDQKIILWGSSYSSALALHVAGNQNVKAVISFSPGDYFGDKKDKLANVIPSIEKPFFITSSKKESVLLSKLMEGVTVAPDRIQFIPQSEGFHGSKALWIDQEGAEKYWSAVNQFLSEIE